MSAPPQKVNDWKTRATIAFTPPAIAQRLTACYLFVRHHWGNQRMEAYLRQLEFTEEFKDKLIRMVLDPTLQAAVKTASIIPQSFRLTCAQRWAMLGLLAQHMKLCPAGCNENCVIKLCYGNAKATQIGAPNEAAQTNRHRPMMVCPNWQHTSFVTSKPGEKERKGMTYIYLDIWYKEKIEQ